MAIGPYDHVADLTADRVRAEGLDLTFVQLPVEQILQRFARYREWEVSEFSLAQYVALRSRGDESLIAIPVFPSRVFRHGSVYVRAGGIDDMSALAGRRVGIPEWAQTAGVWARGILASEYDVALDSVEWVQAGLDEPGRAESVETTLPDGVRLERRPDTSLGALLRAGEIDAVISARPPRNADGRIVRLLADHVAAEKDWWRRTHIHPIMHVVVLRADVYAEIPWCAANLLAAFDEARRSSLRRLLDTAMSHVALPWAAELLADASDGDPLDWWAYGTEANRRTLQAFVDFAVAQGVAAAPVAAERLFARETLFSTRI
ncbi:ABC transporter substrate-binding protein [Saccharopolyspora sp. K220]|uniref:ABC transporter substrate-binding protein n=1 Tax=Saccharopolyspora soli TaxID=2926618 RepID=UPI001F5640BC|nr:ABC transporter substrate-binding protein [Saccharopolyspora soli]MCI2419248.1 ABC transporter substrate-binding protein [Saccharopolyspora soli]